MDTYYDRCPILLFMYHFKGKGVKILEIRRLTASEIDQAIQLADETFREVDHTSMGEAFPQVFSKSIIHSFGAFDEDKLISFMGLVPSRIKIGEAILNVFSIGAVCTHEDYRRKGLSTAILKRVYQYIDQAGASLLFISGDRGLYTRNHCYHFGRTKQYTIKQPSIHKDNDQILVRPYEAEDIFQIDGLRTKKNVRIQSNLWEWSNLLQAGGYTSIFKMKQTCFVAENQGIIEGYVVCGLPTDKSTKQEAIITESGGAGHVVHHILKNILAKNLADAIEIKIPWQDTFDQEFNEYPAKELTGGGTLYVVDATKLIKQVQPYLIERNPELAKSLEIVEISDHTFKLTGKQLNITCTREELVSLFFDTKSKHRNNELQTLFPLPLPIVEGMYYV